MPRQPRLHVPGGLYHVIVRGIERRSIFFDDFDRKEFLSRFEQAFKKTDCRCYAWALMPNHFHFLLRPGAKPLSDLMRRVLSGYAVHFNRRHHRTGYLFQNRYKAILCQDAPYFIQLVRYIHLNPLRAGLVPSFRSLETYPWSGHSVILGNQKASWQEVGEVLSHFSDNGARALQRYLDFLGEPTAREEQPQLLGGGLKRSAGGWPDAPLSREELPGAYDNRILGDGDFVVDALKQTDKDRLESIRFQNDGWTIEKLVKHVCASFDLNPKTIGKRGRENSVSQARDLVAYLGRNKMGFPASDVQRVLSISQPGLSKAVQRGEMAYEKTRIEL